MYPFFFETNIDITKNKDKIKIIVAPTGTDKIAETNSPIMHENIDINADNKYIKDILFVN